MRRLVSLALSTALLSLPAVGTGSTPYPTADFLPGGEPPTLALEGHVVLSATHLGVREHTRAPFLPPVDASLPVLAFDVVSDGGHVIPARRGLVVTDHPVFDVFVSPGRAWSQSGTNRASLPFALMNRWVNCTHNGLVTFAYDANALTDVRFLVNQETCHFLKFDLWGEGRGQYRRGSVAALAAMRANYAVERESRVPTRPLEQLTTDHGVDVSRLLAGLPENDDLTTAGAYFEGVHYTLGCRTRSGPYPYCESMLHTSFSTAKTAFPAVVLMALARRDGLDVYDAKIVDYVPEARAAPGDWSTVTFGQTGDMTSGNFAIDEPLADPAPGDFYLDLDRAGKLAAALAWPRGAPPGTRFAYQTGDTFVLVNALDAYLARHVPGYDDAFTYLVDTVLRPLGVPPEVQVSRRTREGGRVNGGTAFGGMGMWWTADAVVRVARFLAIDGGRIDGREVLHPAALAATLQRDPVDRGIDTRFHGAWYNNGTWAARVPVGHGGRTCEVWVPFMTGLSGVRVVMMPNDFVFYYFNDAQAFPLAEVVHAAGAARPFCDGGAAAP